MTTDQLHKFHTAKPFHPFRIHVADGKSLRVDHPEMLAYVPRSRTCALWIPEERAFEIVDLLLVTSLEPATPGKPRGGGNGRSRGPRNK